MYMSAAATSTVSLTAAGLYWLPLTEYDCLSLGSAPGSDRSPELMPPMAHTTSAPTPMMAAAPKAHPIALLWPKMIPIPQSMISTGQKRVSSPQIDHGIMPVVFISNNTPARIKRIGPTTSLRLPPDAMCIASHSR